MCLIQSIQMVDIESSNVEQLIVDHHRNPLRIQFWRRRLNGFNVPVQLIYGYVWTDDDDKTEIWPPSPRQGFFYFSLTQIWYEMPPISSIVRHAGGYSVYILTPYSHGEACDQRDYEWSYQVIQVKVGQMAVYDTALIYSRFSSSKGEGHRSQGYTQVWIGTSSNLHGW